MEYRGLFLDISEFEIVYITMTGNNIDKWKFRPVRYSCYSIVLGSYLFLKKYFMLTLILNMVI